MNKNEFDAVCFNGVCDFWDKKTCLATCKSPSNAKYLVKRENEASYFYRTNKFHVIFFQKYSFLIECRWYFFILIIDVTLPAKFFHLISLMHEKGNLSALRPGIRGSTV